MHILDTKVTFATNTSSEGGANTFPWKKWFFKVVFLSVENQVFFVVLSNVKEMNEQLFPFNIIKTRIKKSKADAWKKN